MSTLYYGDDLNIMGRYLDDESVDLVYLDPRFNRTQITTPSSRKRTAPLMKPRLDLLI